MKNRFLIISALAFSVNAWAQNPQTVSAEDKSASMYRNIDGSRFSPVPAPKEKETVAAVHTLSGAGANDYFCMAHDKMYAVVNGTRTCLDTYIKLPDGSMVMPNGTVISSTGKVEHLKNGERLNVQGSPVCLTRANAKKDQAANQEN